MSDRIIPRHDTMARWAEVNPILMEGEWGIVTDSPSLYKIGNGFTPWNDLPFRGYDGNIVQNEGNSTESVMSQNAVTARLANVNANITKLQTDVAVRYTKQEVDAKENKLREDVDAEYAKKDGAYPKMTSGFAENIIGDGSATPEEFSFRPTAGEDRNVANTTYYEGERNGVARIERIKGNSVVWNNYADVNSNLRGSQTINGVTFINNGDGSISVQTESSGASEDTNLTCGIMQTPKTYFLIGGAPTTASLETYYISDFWSGASTSSQKVTKTTHQTSDIRIVVKKGATIVTPVVFRPILTNLTQMFGADNEPTTIEEFYVRTPQGVDINAYNEGEIVDGHYGAIKTVGYNQWDEQRVEGIYNLTTGLLSQQEGCLSSKNPIKVVGGCQYVITATNYSGYQRIIFYDEKMNLIGVDNYRKFTTPQNCRYVNFSLNTYGSTYNNDVCINIAWDEYAHMNGMYQPYKPFTRDLSWVNKYFPATINGETKYGVRSAGSVRDEFRFNSTTQKWEAVQNVGVRAYVSGDESNSEVTTDGTNTNYALTTPDVKEIEEIPNMDFDVSDYGTEELIVAEGAQSAPIVADIAYAPNALSTLKQVPDILKRLKALESALAQQTTNVEPSNIEE